MPEERPQEEQRTRAFNPNDHLMQIKSSQGNKDYLPVAWRLVWFRSLCPQGTIDTEELEYDQERVVEAEVFAWNPEKRRSEKTVKKAKGYARYRAVVTDGKGGRGTGTKSENAANFADYGEKAETGSIGRALAALGYGTQFTGDELNEGIRIVDSPIERSEPTPVTQAEKTTETPVPVAEGTPIDPPSSEQQQSSIRKLCEHLGREVPTDLEKMAYQEAKDLITSLSKDYREMRGKQATGATPPAVAEPPLEPVAAPVVKATIVPKAVAEEVAEKDPLNLMDEEDWSYILGLRNEIGPYEFKEVAKKVEAPLSLLEWEKTHVLAFKAQYTLWPNAGQQAWRDQKKNDFQGAELGKLVTAFGAKAVGALRDRIPGLKGIESKNLTQGQADILIGYGQKGMYYLLIADKLNLDLGALFYKGQVSVLDFFENKARLANYGKFQVALQGKLEAHEDLPDEITDTYRYLELNTEASRAKETQAA